jgi:hypothetical protein
MPSPLRRWPPARGAAIGEAQPGNAINGRVIGRFARRESCSGKDVSWVAEYTPSEVTPMLMLVPMAT